MDEAFFGRVLRTGVVVAALVGLMLWGWQGAKTGMSFLAGALIGLAVLEGTVAFANVIARPPDERPERGWPYVVLHVVKYAIVGAVFWFLICQWKVEVIWLAVGLGLPMVVMFLKLAGQAAVRKTTGVDEE